MACVSFRLSVSTSSRRDRSAVATVNALLTHGQRPRRRRGLCLPAFCAVAVLLLSPGISGQPAPLTVPALGTLSVREGFLSGAEGVQLFYRFVGESPNPIVFLHGGPGLGIDDGGYDLEGLATKGHALLLLNQRGAGRSEVIGDATQLGLDAYVRDLERLREHFALPRMALIGLSWGAAVVAAYAAQHPDRVGRIVFLSPMSLTRKSGDERAARLLALLSPQAVARLTEIGTDAFWSRTPDAELPGLCRESLDPVLRFYVTDPTHLGRTRGNMCGYAPAALRNMNRVGDATIGSLGKWDFRPWLRTIRSPALVVEGAESKVPLDDVRAWTKALSNGRLLLVPRAGHMSWLDQPEAVIAALDEFFRGGWPRLARR